VQANAGSADFTVCVACFTRRGNELRRSDRGTPLPIWTGCAN